MEQNLREAIKGATADLGMPEVDFSVEHPADAAHGDFATNVALVVAKQAGEQPRHCAERIVAALLTQSIPNVASIEIAGPGFINITLARTFFSEQIHAVCANPDTWGRNSTQSKEQVLVEYTSPNLFKPLHVGNLVGNIIGESLTRLYEYAGAEVKRLNYPSDIGLTVAKGVWGLAQTGGNPDDINALGEAYRFGNNAYEEGGEQKEAIIAVNKALYAGSDQSLAELRTRGIATSRARLAELCDMLGTTFDAEIFESEAGPVGKAIVEEHTGSVFTKSEGAVVFEGERVGLHTRVFLNSQGLPTYEAKDLGNFILKQEQFPHWTQSLVVTGNEQTEYFKVLFAALAEIFPAVQKKKLLHIPTGFLTLTTGKMSSRKGNVLSGEAMLEELQAEARACAQHEQKDISSAIAVAALKYQILKSHLGANMVFDKEKALSFEGDSGPYLQYTHARICSVLEKAEEVGVAASVDAAPASTYELERIVARFPEVVAAALVERAPHHLVRHLTDLAGAFNTFYAHEKIADPTDVHAPYKVLLADAVRQTLKNGLWCLGIQAPEKM